MLRRRLKFPRLRRYEKWNRQDRDFLCFLGKVGSDWSRTGAYATLDFFRGRVVISQIFRGKNDEEVGNEADERGEDEREEEDGEVSRRFGGQAKI